MQDEAAAFRQFKDLLKAEHGKENVNPRAGQFVRSTSAAACLSRPPTVPKSNATDASEACWQEEESAGAKAPRISCLRRGSSSSNVSDISEDALRIASCKMSPREPSLDKELSVAGKVPRRRPLLRERPQSAQKLKARPASGRRSAMEHGTDNSSRKSSASHDIAQQRRARVRCAPPRPTSLPPRVTAKAWIALDASSGQVVGGSSHRVRMGMASLTKIMTCHLVVQLAKMDLAVLHELLLVSRHAATVVGTSARLLPGDVLSVGEALYGLMLPSGNDAALALAEHFGERMRRRRVQARQLGRCCHPTSAPRACHLRMRLPPPAKDSTKAGADAQSGIRFFVADMNAAAQSLGLHATSFTNPHGLSAPLHQSTAEDLALLCQHVMRDPLFAQIVSTQSRTARVSNEAEDKARDITWTNTNELLNEGFCGIKTGTTPTTGFCLAAEFRIQAHRPTPSPSSSSLPEEQEETASVCRGELRGQDPGKEGREGQRLVVVLLASATKQARTNDTRMLVEWARDALANNPPQHPPGSS